ncbi:regulatory protein viviparous-1-like, partial [Curcuma longa]|uniref:regulatory protein viviparous-1-like n=1 Tax=Curcuma longa TaxID=136217 RepID=UPI003D9E7D55
VRRDFFRTPLHAAALFTQPPQYLFHSDALSLRQPPDTDTALSLRRPPDTDTVVFLAHSERSPSPRSSSFSRTRADLGGWTRIVVEKPFGKDLNSAEDLSALCKELQVALCKELTKSDVGNTGRIVLPKREAEACLPPLSERDGIVLHMEDMALQCSWKFKYRYLQKGVSSEQEDVLSRFLQLIKYVSGSYDSADGFQTFSLSFMQEY